MNSDIGQIFLKHVANYNLSYGSLEDFNFRANIFAQLDANLEAFNNEEGQTSVVGHNIFSTWTVEERLNLGVQILPT